MKKTNRCRVLDSTYKKYSNKKEMIGKIYDFTETFIDEKLLIIVWNENKSNYWFLNEFDIQRLTEVEYAGNLIGIGDEVRFSAGWYKVEDYIWYNSDWHIAVKRVDEHKEYIFLTNKDIKNHKPLHPQKEITIKQAEELLKGFGEVVKIK